MRVVTKLSAGFLLLIVLFGGLVLYYHRVLENSVRSGRALARIDARVLLAAANQLELVDRMEEDASKYRITRDDGYLRAYRAWHTAVADTIAVLDGLPLEGGPAVSVRQLSHAWSEFVERSADLTPEVEARFLATADSVAWSEFRRAVDVLRRRTADLHLTSRSTLTTRIREISAEADRAVRAGWVGIGLALILGAVIAGLIVRSISRPLRRVEEGAAAIARGDFATRVEVGGGVEFRSLAESFNHMAERVGEIDRAKRDFLARISHDLKTPLASVRETFQIVLDGIPGALNEKQTRLLELGSANARRLSSMISKLLELSRLEAGAEEYELERIDLVDLSAEVVERIAPGWEADGRGLKLVANVDSAEVTGDRGALVRVLENLIDNARRHAEGDAEVTVRQRRATGPAGAVREAGLPSGPEATVEVHDHGPGIEPARRERIFERFSRRRAGSGAGHVGLGLAICREIVSAHGGSIRVEDSPEGGALFAFSLPLAPPGEADARAGDDETSASGRSPTPSASNVRPRDGTDAVRDTEETVHERS